jgi:hypothetical protein
MRTLKGRDRETGVFIEPENGFETLSRCICKMGAAFHAGDGNEVLQPYLATLWAADCCERIQFYVVVVGSGVAHILFLLF